MTRSQLLLLTAALAAIVFAGCAAPSAPHDPSADSREGEPNPYGVPDSTTTVPGSGATFPKPLLETWALEFAKKHRTVQVNYPGGGSGKGISDITDRLVVFGASDAPLSVAEKEKAPTLIHIAETLGLNAVVYNVEGVSDGLQLDGATVGKIYVGAIKRWNHADIQVLNPSLSLPDKPITIVYRADSSGTTFVFTDWLTKTSSDWRDTMGGAPSKKPDWTKSSATQLNGNGNDGVGSTVKSNTNTIGYVELAFKKSLNLNAAHLKNRAGEFVAPSTEGAKKAAEAVSLPEPAGDWSKVSITDAEGQGAYPVASFSYILVHHDLEDYDGKFSRAQVEAFRAWLWWGLHDGQGYAEILGYAPLPRAIVDHGVAALATIQV